MKQYILLYFSTLVVMTALDLLWLGLVAKEFYQQRLGSLLEFHFLPGILFYLMYAAGIIIFVSGGSKTWQEVALYGALLGFLAYATYDLTNLATLRGWSLSMSLVDMAWGTFVTAVSATSGWLLTRYMTHHVF